MLTVEAVRAALQSLPDAWKRQYEHEVGWPPYRAKMKIHQETTLAQPQFVDLAQAFLASFREQGGATTTSTYYSLLRRVDDMRVGLAPHDPLYQLFLYDPLKMPYLCHSIFLPVAILVAAGDVIGPLKWEWFAGDVYDDSQLYWSGMDPKSRVGDAACPRVTLFCHLPPNLHLPPSHLPPASHLPSCPRTAGGTCQSARKPPDAHLDGDQYAKRQPQAGGKMFGEAGRLVRAF